jgi:signal transduction histidine kinase
MAGGIAHEVNTPLAVIQTVAEQLAESIEETVNDNPAALADPEFVSLVKDQTGTIRSTVARIAKIIRAMRSFARDGHSDPMTRVSLASVLDETLSLCGESLRLHGIKVELTGVDPARSLDCRPTELAQVFLNLLNNCRDALAGIPSPWVRIEVRDEGLGRGLEIRVSDNGKGIQQEVRERLFQPFFTTKPPGEGTGLGLGISRTIVEAHGGTLTLVQFPQIPTTFVVSLPELPPTTMTVLS